MDVTADDFRRHYESLSDEALLEIDSSELVKIARECLAEEVARRGITDAAVDDEDSAPADSTSDGPVAEEEFICVAEYDYHDEADLARGMLETEGIQAGIETEPGVVRLMVPAAQAERALGMLAAVPLSDEELAAQAEAAGFEGDEEEEEVEDPEP